MINLAFKHPLFFTSLLLTRYLNTSGGVLLYISEPCILRSESVGQFGTLFIPELIFHQVGVILFDEISHSKVKIENNFNQNFVPNIST
jgi:hypothetical protein